MAIKVKNKDLRIALGRTPIRSVMLGNKCVCGENLAMYAIDYPATPKGTGFYISVNDEKIVSNPTESGKIGVVEGDKIVIRTYALSNYMNPDSAVIGASEEIAGVKYSVNLGDEISIERATIFTFIAMSNLVLEISEAEPAPKVIIPIIKDEGVSRVTCSFYNSPFSEAFSSNKSFSSSKSSSQTVSDYFELYYGSKIVNDSFSATFNEGYKRLEIEFKYVGLLTYDNQCEVTISSLKGKEVYVSCPALTDGISSYNIKMVKSEFSRSVSTTNKIYEGSAEENIINSRIYIDSSNQKYTKKFYEGDVIKISAVRRHGYKLPTLGKIGDTSEFVLSKEITLEDNTDLVVSSGEKGILVSLENNALSSGEYVYLTILSEYYDTPISNRNPYVYVGDSIIIHLTPVSRVGTRTHRKPGVGLSNGTDILVPITFSSEVEYKVQAQDKKICVLLEQGAERVATTSFRPTNALLKMDDNKTYTTSGGWYGDVVPVNGLGEETYYIKSLRLVFYTKRYTTDIFTDKFNRHDYSNIPSPFSYSCKSSVLGTVSNVLAGNYTISDDNSSVTMKITTYNKLWVANTTRTVDLYAWEIIV